MADRTLQILPGGQSPAPFTYSVPASTSFTLLAVRAVLDGTAAAGAFLPCVQLVSDAGVVMAETIGDSVAAGDSADASFFPLRRRVVAASGGNFAATVLTIAPANTLRGYWRLGEVASPFADTSGFSGGPNDMTVHVSGTAYTTHVAGALPFGQDDGALQFNANSGTGYYLTASTAVLTPNLNTGFSIAGFVKPGAVAGDWNGAIFGNHSNAGSPFPSEEGWFLGVSWSGGLIVGELRRAISNVARVAQAAITAGSWAFLVGTYDGASLRLYLNGALVATTADARADTFAIYDSPTIDLVNLSSPAAVTYLYGVVDEVALWGHVLSASDIATLYAASQS